MMLKFQPWAGAKVKITVDLNGKRVGTIKKDDAGYYYQPKGSRITGERMPTVEAVKASLRN